MNLLSLCPLFFLALYILPASALLAEGDDEDALDEILESEEKAETEDFDKLARSLFIEAEDMTGVDPTGKSEQAAWKVNPATPLYASRESCLCSKLEPITKKIRIPAEDTYHIWPRYRIESGKVAPFVLRIEAGGKSIFEHRYYNFRVGGSGMVADIQKEHKLWFDGEGMQEGAFAGEDWAWEHAKAKLPAGEATLIIEPQRSTPKFAQHIDCILLTASAAYRPKFSDFREVWARYRPVSVEPADREFSVSVVVQWLAPVIINGQIQIATSAGILKASDGKWLQQGANSAWVELYDELKRGREYCATIFAPYYPPKPISKVSVEVDIGWGPREGQIIKTLKEIADVGDAIGTIMPTERARKSDEIVTSIWPSNFTNTFATFADLSLARHERIKKLVPESLGAAKYFNFCTGVTQPGYTYASTEIYRQELLSVARLGINTLYGSDYRLIRGFGLTHLFPPRFYTATASPIRYLIRHTCPNHPDGPRAAEEAMALWGKQHRESCDDANAGANVFGMKIGDEIGVEVDEPHIDTCEDCQHRFREFLKTDGFDPAPYGKTWEDVRWVASEEATDDFRRALYHRSVLFLSANTGYLYAEAIRAAERHFAPRVPVIYNVNPTPIMSGMALDWYQMDRVNGINGQWLEVLGHIQPGGPSFLADLAWGITSRRNLIIGVYLIYVGQEKSARDTLAFSARGCRSFIFYNYGPKTLGAADNFSEHDPSLLAVSESTQPILAAEEFFNKAERSPRQAVMIYSRTAEIWGEDNAVVHDRPYTYLALNHSGIPMDIIPEQDVLDGRLENYKVAYLNGTHLRRDVAIKIREWVKSGGHLWGDVGAAMRDEADRRLDVLEPVFGAKQQFVDRKYPVSFGYYLGETPDAEMGKVTWKPGPWGKGGETQCELQRASVEPAGGEVVATFDDGAPAAFTHQFGKGRSLLLAYSAGLTYSRFYRLKERVYPLRYEELDRMVIAQFALDAGAQRPVLTSKPGIEATRLDSEKGIAITLIDQWSQKPTVTIELETDHQPTQVRSVKSGNLPFKHEGRKLSFEVSFGNLDIVTIE